MPGFTEWLETPAGRVPAISPATGFGDRLGACKVRWGIGRTNYMVPPGLYAIGRPTPDSPVLVTANYKMSYDIIRRTMAGRDIWLLVLETYGINVWCAAGKGTFGTGELVRRVESTGLAKVVSHRRLILPILGAPGVAAYQVARRCGFSVSFAAIRAVDLPEYLDNGMVTTPAMRQLTFTFYERLVLVPVELVTALKSVAVVAGAIIVPMAAMGDLAAAMTALFAYVGAVLAGVVFGPVFLPWLPGKSFAVKGALVGLVWSGIFYLLAGGRAWGMPATAALFLAPPAVSAFHTLGFTGCSTYTSRSGVKKEMRIALPAMGGALIASILLLLAEKLL